MTRIEGQDSDLAGVRCLDRRGALRCNVFLKLDIKARTEPPAVLAVST
jgi:hypothetical protein